MNLHQHDFQMAIGHIDQVLAATADCTTVRTGYGSLALGLGPLIHQNGLCQALAFLASKATRDDRGRPNAHQLVLDHLAAILGQPPADLLAHVAGLSSVAYLHATERVQAAWVFHKRFAESVLGATKGEEVTA